MDLSKLLNKLISAPDTFLNKLSDIERQVFGEVQNAIKAMQTDRAGKIVANVENLKTVNSIKVKLEKMLLSSDYKSAVKDFVKEFQNISSMSKEYFNFSKMPNSEMFKGITDFAIDNTLESLTGTGYTSTVVSKLGDMLIKSVTGGGMYNDLVEQIRTELLTTDKTTGLLTRYAKTYTTDALSQFSGQQMKLASEGLKTMWFQYVGSNKTSSREFCQFLTQKEFIHQSELHEIIKGHINGHTCEINHKTGLPLGMINGTNIDNFIIYRGGYNCQHSLIPVNELAVPFLLRQKYPSI